MSLTRWIARLFASDPPRRGEGHAQRAAVRDQKVKAVLDGVQELKRALASFEDEMKDAGFGKDG